MLAFEDTVCAILALQGEAEVLIMIICVFKSVDKVIVHTILPAHVCIVIYTQLYYS